VVVPRDKLRETFDSLYGDLQEMHVIFEKKRIRVLSPSAASLTAWAHYIGIRKDGQKVDNRALFTILCLRKQGKWSIFQAHKSLLLSYQGSETSKARPRLSKFCRGNGIDLGYGGDPIVPSAITMDLPSPYTKVGAHAQNLAGDARDLYWLKDNVLDYVYSSHLLEDFSSKETAAVLREWLRVIKVGGVLVLYGPDQQAYLACCREKGNVPNPGHKVDDYGLRYIKEILELNFRGQYTIVHEIGLVDNYSFDLVVRKLK
jgi:predicted SAM-dependent methyltransferase